MRHLKKQCHHLYIKSAHFSNCKKRLMGLYLSAARDGKNLKQIEVNVII